ncbi:MAG: SusD/RagB family nutrient-binding outer membrane lipoprotein [Sediminicola sp.]
MKNILLKFGFFASVALILGSCTKDFDEINTNPLALDLNSLENDPLLQGQLFARAQFQTFYSAFQTGQNQTCDIWSQYFATTQSRFETDRYAMIGGWIDNQWRIHYSEEIKQLKTVMDLSQANGNEVANAMAKISWVFAFQRLTDYFGPMPYFEYGNLELTVPYDSQEAIYSDFFVKLDEAVAQLEANPGGSAYAASDRMYGGNGGAWLKFANSLRLRVAMRIRYADPAKAQAEAEKAVAAGVFMENSEGAYVATDEVNFHRYQAITDWGEFRMSALAESILEGYGDPRIEVMYAPAEDGDSDGDGSAYEGLLNGQTVLTLEAGQNLNHSDMALKWKSISLGGANPPYTAMNAAEAYFLRAEGAMLGWNMGGSAKELYEEGIRKSMTELLNIDATAIESYIASTSSPVPYEEGAGVTTDIPVAFAAEPERQLEQIITQKWIANYGCGYESWAELRRTGYPKQYERVTSDNPDVATDEIISRSVYPTIEYDRNLEELQFAVDNYLGGPDKASTKLWWDKN